MTMIQRFIKDESGATAIEYGLLAALLSVMVIAGAKLVGGNMDALFDGIGSAMSSACSSANTAGGSDFTCTAVTG